MMGSKLCMHYYPRLDPKILRDWTLSLCSSTLLACACVASYPQYVPKADAPSVYARVALRNGWDFRVGAALRTL